MSTVYPSKQCCKQDTCLCPFSVYPSFHSTPTLLEHFIQQYHYSLFALTRHETLLHMENGLPLYRLIGCISVFIRRSYNCTHNSHRVFSPDISTPVWLMWLTPPTFWMRLAKIEEKYGYTAWRGAFHRSCYWMRSKSQQTTVNKCHIDNRSRELWGSHSSAHEDPKSSGYDAVEIGTEVPTSCSNLMYTAVARHCVPSWFSWSVSLISTEIPTAARIFSFVTNVLQWKRVAMFLMC